MYTLGELAQRFDAQIIGDANCLIKRVATLNTAKPGDISFLSNSTYKKYLASTSASAVIISKDCRQFLNTNGLVVDDPYVVYAKVAALLHPVAPEQPGIHPSAYVHSDSRIADTASIGPNCSIAEGVSIGEHCTISAGCVIERNASLGKKCYLYPNVTVCHDSQIGDKVILHPGVVIGSDGFGLANEKGKWLKIPQIGKVRIADDVEIGANSTIDRGAIEDTVLEQGVKLDNLIQVAHNVSIGENTAIAACSAIAGSVKIGRNCQIGGKVGIVGHLEITDNVHITAMSLVTHSINKPGVYSSGTPLQSNKMWQKNAVRIKQLDELARTIKKIGRQLDKKNG